MKKLLALLLAICLCLTFAACGEDKEEEISKGEKMYKKYKEIISYMEDGNYDAAYDAMVALSGDSLSGENNGSEFSAYEDIFEALTREDFSAAIEAIIRLENSKNQKEPTDFMKLLANEWYGAKYIDNQLPEAMSVTFDADGSCNILGNEYTWTVNSEWDNNMNVKIYSGSTQVYSAEVSMNENEIARLAIWDSLNNGNHIGNFYLEPMTVYAVRYWYRLDDTVETMPEDFSLSSEWFSVNDSNYRWNAVESSNEELIIEAYTNDPANVSYRMRVFLRDGIYVCELTDVTSNVTTLYYNSGNGGYSEDWVEYRYYWAYESMTDVLNGYSIRYEGTYYSGRAAWEIIYKMFDGCRGYSEADNILSNFKIVEGKYTDRNTFTKDNLDNTTSSTWDQYSYNSAGNITFGDSRELELLLFCTYSNNTYSYYFEYDENDNLSKIIYGWSRDNASAIFTPVYDDNGRIVSMERRTNSGTYYNTYTYDDAGRLESVTVYDRTIYFSYDENGKLLKISGTIYYSGYTTEFDIVFTYGDNGHCINKTMNFYLSRQSSWNTDKYISYDYTCDENGNVISAVITGTDYDSYASYTQEYIYKDLYFYEP